MSSEEMQRIKNLAAGDYLKIPPRWRRWFCRHPEEQRLSSYLPERDPQSRVVCGRCGALLPSFGLLGLVWRRVRWNDLEDKLTKAPRWMGSVGELKRFAKNEVVFTVLGVNVAIDLAVRAWRWAKYRRPSAAHQALENAYRRGRVDAHREAKAEAWKALNDQHQREVRELHEAHGEALARLQQEHDEFKTKAERELAAVQELGIVSVSDRR